jgi:hypothetical protein
MQKMLYCVLILLSSTLYSKGQGTKTPDSTIHQRINNIVPRLAIGASRHFITEFGIAFMRSNFTDHEHFGLNVSNLIVYLGFETMTPYKQPFIYGYKIGIERVSGGHVTGAIGIETGYFQKDTLSSFVITPKFGIPLINGSLSYGFSFFTEPGMRKEIGRHRVSLTYCFNRKSDRAFDALLAKRKKKTP